MQGDIYSLAGLTTTGLAEIRTYAVATLLAILPFFALLFFASALAPRRPGRLLVPGLALWAYLLGFLIPALYAAVAIYGCRIDNPLDWSLSLCTPPLVMLRAARELRLRFREALPYGIAALLADLLASLLFTAST